VWKKIVVSGLDVVDEERLGEEQKTRPAPGRRVVESGGTAGVAEGGGKKKVKNKLPGGIDKKIPARFFSPNPTGVDGEGWWRWKKARQK